MRCEGVRDELVAYARGEMAANRRRTGTTPGTTLEAALPRTAPTATLAGVLATLPGTLPASRPPSKSRQVYPGMN